MPNIIFGCQHRRFGVVFTFMFMLSAHHLNAQLMRVYLEVSGDFFLKPVLDSMVLTRWDGGNRPSIGMNSHYLLQTALSDLADRSQQAHRKLRTLKWLEIRSLENVQFILDIEHDPWWVRAPTIRYLSDGAGSLVESTIISSYPTTLMARMDEETGSKPAYFEKSVERYSAWLGYPIEVNGKIILCYII